MKKRDPDKIIGGMFGLQATPDANAGFPPFFQEELIYLVNARSGVWLLINQLKPQQVWLPSYVCPSLIVATSKTSTKIRFYEVDSNLKISSLSWLKQIQKGDLIILIDYFGFNIDLQNGDQIKKRGAWILEDASQALLTGGVGQFSDFIIYSPRKFVGVPDGGILRINCDFNVDHLDFETPPTGWWLKALSASAHRRDFDIKGGERHWFTLFKETEPSSPTGFIAMSELSKALLQNNFDYETISKRRVNNYKILAEKLRNLALFPSLPKQTIPIGFPIRVKERDNVLNMLYANNIYPPVHWRIKDLVPLEFSDSHILASEIMTLPCDQRYDSYEMERIVKVISEVSKC